MNHQEIIDRIDARWTEFRALIDSVPEALRYEPVPPGAWNVRDIVGHIAWWENGTAEDLLGQTADDNHPAATVDERNAMEYARISSLSYPEALAELDASHALITQVVRDTPSVQQEDVEGDTWEHYEEHGADIRKWLASLES